MGFDVAAVEATSAAPALSSGDGRVAGAQSAYGGAGPHDLHGGANATPTDPGDGAPNAAQALSTLTTNISQVRDQVLPAFWLAVRERGFEDARSLDVQLRLATSLLYQRLATARYAVGEARKATDEQRSSAFRQAQDAPLLVVGDVLGARLQSLELEVTVLRGQIDDALAAAPAPAASYADDPNMSDSMDAQDASCAPGEDPDAARVDPDDAARARWNASLDDEESRRFAVARLEARDQPAHPEAECAISAGVAQHHVRGIELALNVDRKDWPTDERLPPETIGPGRAGPYALYPNTLARKIVYYEAWHVSRGQAEWLIGPDDVGSFIEGLPYYIAAARYAYPGSAKIAGSQSDGAEVANNGMSSLERSQLGLPVVDAPPETSILDALEGAAPPDLEDSVEAAPNGGHELVGHRNVDLRMEYVRQSEEIAQELLDRLRGGEDHMALRTEAVERRNRRLLDTREEMSPAAHHVSSKLKSDRGVTEAEMVTRKLEALLAEAAPMQPGARMDRWSMDRVMGRPGDQFRLRDTLAADSEWWEPFGSMLERWGSRDADYEALLELAQEQLVESPALSEAIIHSSGKNNRAVTALCRASHFAGIGLLALAAYEIVAEIYSAPAGEKLHALAGAGAGFAGGVVGGEVGAVAGAEAGLWVASLLPAVGGAPLMVVSAVAGMFGAEIGAHVGVEAWKRASEVVLDGTAAYAGPGSAQGGGYAGLYERSQRVGAAPPATAIDTLKEDLFELDMELVNVSGKIERAESRDDLEKLQKLRLLVIERRNALSEVYALVLSGSLTESGVVDAASDAAPLLRNVPR